MLHRCRRQLSRLIRALAPAAPLHALPQLTSSGCAVWSVKLFGGLSRIHLRCIGTYTETGTCIATILVKRLGCCIWSAPVAPPVDPRPRPRLLNPTHSHPPNNPPSLPWETPRRYNGRVAAALLPCLLTVAAVGGASVLACLTVGAMVVYLMDALQYREGAFTCAWLTLAATNVSFTVALLATSDAPVGLQVRGGAARQGAVGAETVGKTGRGVDCRATRRKCT